MSKVVYSRNWNGYYIPDEVLEEYCKRAGVSLTEDTRFSIEQSIPRHDSLLIELVENYISSHDCGLSIKDIGEAEKYYLEEYDGIEYVYTEETIPWMYVNKSSSNTQ